MSAVTAEAPSFSWSFTAPGQFNGEVSFSTGLFISNEFASSVEGATLDIVNPATGKNISSISAATEKDVDAAVLAARKAFETTWGLHTPGVERGKMMNRLASLIEEHADELSAIEVLNAGVTIVFARYVSIRIAAEVLRYYAGWADKIHGKTIEVNETKFAYTRLEPIGVVAGIIPWNAPLVMACLKLAPALAAGNCILLKVSEVTPLTALRLGSLVKEAGFPPGVVSILPGLGNVAGAAMSSHMGIGKISFTGSTLIGRHIAAAAASSNLKKVSLELGGKSPSVILEDADITEAAKWSAFGSMINQGQMCCAGSRIYVHSSIYDKFMTEFMAVIKGIKIGDPFDFTTFYGPQVNETHFNRVMGFIKLGKLEGATLLQGGDRHGSEGFFIEPTVFESSSPDLRIAKEEIFGPVVVIGKFSTDEELLELANGSTYGLAAAIFSRDISKATQMAHKLEAGTIWINAHSMIEFSVPFGGYKQSGNAREYGEDALRDQYEIKAVHVNLTAKAPV